MKKWSNFINWIRSHSFLDEHLYFKKGPFGRGVFTNESISVGKAILRLDANWIITKATSVAVK